MKIVLIDNNDSFTNNLEHLLVKYIADARVTVHAYSDVFSCSEDPVCDQSKLSDLVTSYDLLVISPGPGSPQDYSGYGPLLDSGKPVLGICLGMQIINEHFGGRTSRLTGCFHGRTENINFDNKRIAVARYHSLYCEQIGKGLQVTAVNGDNIPMAIAHKERPLLGYQFHPESFLTEDAGVFIDYALDHLGICQL